MKPATPTPWHVIDGQVFIPQDEGCDPVVAVFCEPMEDLTDQDIQNARYAVHAANLYPELVEACQLALEHKADEYRGTFDSRMDNDPLVTRLRAVLTKAKEGR